MKNTTKILEKLAQEHPVGTESNNIMLDFVENCLKEMGYTVKSLPFNCMVWRQGSSVLRIAGQAIPVEPSPFSEPFHGERLLCVAGTLEGLRGLECRDAILLLSGELTKIPLSPKDYPFYYPDEHEELITLLERKNPAAIIAATGATPLNGKNPFPLFEDGNFLIPSANIGTAAYADIGPLIHGEKTLAHLVIDSNKIPSRSRQLIASKKAETSKGKIIIAAHMDSKYDTLGALDNAAGVAVLLETAARLKVAGYDIDILPFNSEEYYGANGELEYLKRIEGENIVLMVNIDSPCHKGSKTAISFYNFDDEMQAVADKVMDGCPRIVKGQEWYAGDHAPFLFRGTPCMAVTSSDFFDGALSNTHTPKDTLDTVDESLAADASKYLVDMITTLL